MAQGSTLWCFSCLPLFSMEPFYGQFTAEAFSDCSHLMESHPTLKRHLSTRSPPEGKCSRSWDRAAYTITDVPWKGMTSTRSSSFYTPLPTPLTHDELLLHGRKVDKLQGVSYSNRAPSERRHLGPIQLLRLLSSRQEMTLLTELWVHS